MPLVRLMELLDAGRRRLSWAARAMFPIAVLFSGLFGEAVVTPAVSRNTAEAATPQPVTDDAQRQEGLVPKGHAPVLVDHKIRRKQASPVEEASGAFALPNLTSVEPGDVAAVATAVPSSCDAGPACRSSARPRAPPA